MESEEDKLKRLAEEEEAEVQRLYEEELKLRQGNC